MNDLDKMRRYFVRVGSESPDPHWANGVMMCDWWIRLQEARIIPQSEIDSFLKRLAEEKNPGSGWLEIHLQFKIWAKEHGFTVPD